MFSDLVYILVYHIAGYRKKVVNENLKLVFPNKSFKELTAIKKKFYKHMCDMFFEMIKSISITKNQLNKRFIIKNPEELKRLEGLNKSIILMYGHYASYEWSYVIENHLTYKGYGIYKRIKNRYFDKLAKRIRSKYNTVLIHTKEAIHIITKNEAEGIKSIIGFLSDQSPKYEKAYYWSNFMSINVPCFTGAEMLAKKLDLSVAYLKVKKHKRGYYEAEFISLADNSIALKDYEITDKFTQALEAQIHEAPEYYLWTHRRWKHRNKVPKEFQ